MVTRTRLIVNIYMYIACLVNVSFVRNADGLERRMSCTASVEWIVLCIQWDRLLRFIITIVHTVCKGYRNAWCWYIFINRSWAVCSTVLVNAPRAFDTVCLSFVFVSSDTQCSTSYSINLEFERDKLLCLPSWSVRRVSTLTYCPLLFRVAIPERLFLEYSLHKLRRFYADIYSSVCTSSSQDILPHLDDNFFFTLLLCRTVWKTVPMFSRSRLFLALLSSGARGWGTALRAVRSRVRSLMGSLQFFIDFIIPAALSI